MSTRDRRLSKWATPQQRFWLRVQKGDGLGCWLWTGLVNNMDYGTFRIGGKSVLVHRFSYELHRGAIPSGMVVMHSCDVPGCVNPDHLKLGTMKDNTQDMMAKGRAKFAPCPTYVLPVYRGEEHGSAKLTNEQAREIRRRARAGEVGRRLAEEFNVTPTLISAIKVGRIWKHLNEEAADAVS